MKSEFPNLTRRTWIKVGATALGLGFWPGCARWKEDGRGGSFHFAVMNDCHYFTARCPEWFERVRASIRAQSPQPEFCLVVGDLAEHGTTAELGGMRDELHSLGLPYHVVIGNHDYISDSDRSAWDNLFPGQLNFWFEHRGWQVIGLDSTQGTQWQKTRIPRSTLLWVEDHTRHLNSSAPTIVFTHFPLAPAVKMRPDNADDLLARLEHVNLVAVFNGHFHGFTETVVGSAVLTTNRCCAISRENHDGTKEKGYFVCEATAGGISRQFVNVPL